MDSHEQSNASPPQSPETRAIHAGREHDDSTALSPPLFQTTTFRLRDAAEGAELASTVAPERFYTRWGNPTTKQCEAVIADLEGAEAALLVASGMGAISTLLLSVLGAGDHVVIGRSIYSASVELVTGFLSRFGIEYTQVDARRVEAVEEGMRSDTRVLLVETPTNPTLELCDLAALGALGKSRGVLTVVDGTFATPVNQNPLSLGFDAVVHAATKGLGGHSDVTAGVICGRGDLIDRCWRTLKLLGACLSPFEAWLLLRGLKTLHARVERQNRTALALASFLETRPGVARVHYPGLSSHPQHDLARRQMRGFGSMVSFEVEGGYEGAVRVAESVRLIQLAVSLGGVETLIQHPASMTHGPLPAEEIRRAGIEPGLLRLSVGLEAPEDLQRDLEHALERV